MRDDDDAVATTTNRTALRVGLVLGAVALGAIALRAIAKAPAPVYRYLSRWRVRGPIDEVAAVLRHAEQYPRWWPAVYLAVELPSPPPPVRGTVGVVDALADVLRSGRAAPSPRTVSP